MSLLGGLMKIAPFVLAPMTGGASLTMATLQQMVVKAVIQQVASQIIQQIGDQLGLPQGITQAALGAFGQAAGFGGANGFPGLDVNGFNPRVLTNALVAGGMTHSDASSFVRSLVKQAQEAKTQELKDSVQSFIDQMNQQSEQKKLQREIDGVMKGKGSILMKLAIALGKVADQKMNDMAKKAEDIGNMGKIEGKNQSKFTQMNAELQALGQELNIVSQSLANVIKSTGEAATALARKG